MRVADVAIDPRSGGSDAVYSYRAEAGLAPGDACFVPLGNRSILGFVSDVYEATEEELGFSFDTLKSIGERVENLSLPGELIELARFVALEYLVTLPVALSAATPPGIRDRIVAGWTLNVELPEKSLFAAKSQTGGTEYAGPLTPAQREVLRTIQDAGGTIRETPTKKFPAAMQKALKLLVGKGLIRQSLHIAPFSDRKRSMGLLRLVADSTKVDRFLAEEGRKKPAQAITLMRLQLADAGAALTPGEIKALAGVTDSTIKALVDAGLLERSEPGAGAMAKPPVPNRYQQVAVDSVVDSIHAGEHRAFLLFGVTGSGKTEIYLRAAGEALKRGRQVLYLVPEIALAAQAIAQLRERFGQSVAILHSDLAPGERLQNWMAIRNGEVSVVLGARSALFAPLDNIGLIVLDEEHEASYKQESAPRYHAKRLALFLGEHHQCPVVLGSATPSIESFYEAEHERLTLLSLPERAASAQLPQVFIDDLTEGFRAGRPSILSEDLHRRMIRTLERSEQIILFLNRRAYAPFIICRDCGYQMACPACAVSLSFHRRDSRLRCHHCGYQIRPPDACPQCGGSRLNPFGVGTEKVEESVAQLFPAARVARLDRDIARRKGAIEETLAAFRSGEIEILVGTQIVAKGLDFPNVTLVGVIAADISLNIPDFRSSERTFQLLSQVAGRAGRGSAPGEVVIQTFNPRHAAVLTAQTHDFLRFYEVLREEREVAGYPPYRRLVNVVFSGPNRKAVLDASQEAAGCLSDALTSDSSLLNPQSSIRNPQSEIRNPKSPEVLGPVDCVMERLQNRWRRHILVKLPADASVAPVGLALAGHHSKGVQIVIDVDPHSLM
ncbi:MAG: primosomal protein N' [Fimbriimonadales bacterium]